MGRTSVIRPLLHRLSRLVFPRGSRQRHTVVADPASAARIAVFISIPKNASNTVREILRLGENRGLENTDSPIIYENHQTGAILGQRYKLDRLFTFCFTRNPYDRCVSWYEFHRKVEPYASMSFTGWVNLGMPHHFTKQNLTDYVKEGLTPLLQTTYTRHTRIDFTGRIESFEQDLGQVINRLNALCEERGIDHRYHFTAGKLNTGGKRTCVDDYYTTATRKRVHELLKEDFLQFGYDP